MSEVRGYSDCRTVVRQGERDRSSATQRKERPSMADDPNKAQAHLQPPLPNPYLKNLDRLVGTWERLRAVFTSRSTRRLPLHLVMVHLIPRLWGCLCLVLLR